MKACSKPAWAAGGQPHAWPAGSCLASRLSSQGKQTNKIEVMGARGANLKYPEAVASTLAPLLQGQDRESHGPHG